MRRFDCVGSRATCVSRMSRDSLGGKSTYLKSNRGGGMRVESGRTCEVSEKERRQKRVGEWEKLNDNSAVLPAAPPGHLARVLSYFTCTPKV